MNELPTDPRLCMRKIIIIVLIQFVLIIVIGNILEKKQKDQIEFLEDKVSTKEKKQPFKMVAFCFKLIYFYTAVFIDLLKTIKRLNVYFVK